MTARFDVEALHVVVCDGVDDLAARAAEAASEAVAAAIAVRGSANVMFASGNSQVAFLDVLARRARHGDAPDWSAVTAFHMDEYVGLPASHPASFARYMRERVAGPLGIGTFHYLDGTPAAGADAEAARYAGLLAAHPLDLCCLGVGENGHLAFNDPPVARFDDPLDVKVVALDLVSRRQQVGEGHFAHLDDVPTHAITATIPALLRAARVLAVVPEARKAEPVRAALEGPVTTECPASALRRCPHATLYLDHDSASLLAGVRP